MSNRRYSFEDERQHAPPQQRYQDSPERHQVPTIQSPPPQYFSAPPPAEPVSPVSAYRPASSHSRHSSRRQQSFDAPRRSIVISNNNDVPPMPPPHAAYNRDALRPEYNNPSPSHDYNAHQQSGGHERGLHMPQGREQRFGGADVPHAMPHGLDSSPYSQERDFPAQNNRYSVPRRPLSRPYPEPGSSGSGIPLAGGAATPGASTPYAYSVGGSSSRHSMRSMPHSGYAMNHADPYDDSPYQRRGGQMSHNAIDESDILPHNIVDDGDDGFMPDPKRRSMLPTNKSRSRERLGTTNVAAGAATGAALGGIFGRKQKDVSTSGSYNAVSTSENTQERSEWLSSQNKGSKKLRWTVGIVIAIVVVLAIVGGVVGGVLGSRNKSGGGGSTSNGNINNAADDTASNGDLGLNSGEIKALMNNKNLHKVFPGMDYTPWGVQYPACLKWPPSQNNVTRDMAVLSQLTNAVRLYGTDCNQTEMVLHAIDRLQLKDMKIWLGVWIDTNQTTTDRQLEKMYKILAEAKDRSIFKGVIIGNEALFRAGQDKTSAHTELVTLLSSARSNFTSLGYDLTVSTSDLGDNWDDALSKASDLIMSNVHPFFAGVNVDDAAGWTWDFWQTHNVPLKPDIKSNYIAETGWPSGGGTDCGNTQNVCAAGQTGSVASIANVNKFMNDWVCQAMANGTNYFWFSAFDEAWKIAYNEVSLLILHRVFANCIAWKRMGG